MEIHIYSIGYLVGDDETVSEDETPLPGLPSIEAQNLEDEARRITARARHTPDLHTHADDVALPFRVPCENDPNIWCVKVKVAI